MSGLKVKFDTVLRLGLSNVVRVTLYKLGLKTGLNSVRRLQADIPQSPYLRQMSNAPALRAVARFGWYDRSEAFGQVLQPLDQAPPAWLSGCFSGKAVESADRNWWQIPDFDPDVGDIKTVWEASRFDWALACAQHHLAGDTEALPRLEHWLADWLLHNPPYKGPNWKCGQEASIRVMHLAMTAHLLGEVGAPTSSLLLLIELHLKRIAPTLQYAIAQDNNHGTSEAAALFIGGSWLAQNNVRTGAAWASKGRRWLENRAARLIEVDGSFSQYSLNYHRVMLDTLSMAELWRSSLDMQAFTEGFY